MWIRRAGMAKIGGWTLFEGRYGCARVRGGRPLKRGEKTAVVRIETGDRVCGAVATGSPAHKWMTLREGVANEIMRYRS
jgi:hypothetical protein